MNQQHDWLLWDPPHKREAIQLRGRAQSALRQELPPELSPRRKEQDSWEIVWGSPAAEFRLLHSQWLAERSRQALIALYDCVEANPSKLGGVPVFRGTRFSVSQLLAELADGEEIADLADNYEVDEALLREFLHALAVYLNKPAF